MVFFVTFLRFVKIGSWDLPHRLSPEGRYYYRRGTSRGTPGKRAGLLTLLQRSRILLVVQAPCSTEVVIRVPAGGRRCASRRFAGAFRARRRGPGVLAGQDPKQGLAVKELSGITRLTEAVSVTLEAMG
jgi:hypothetical protein